MGGMGQNLALVAWVCKILAWAKKLAWVAWVEFLAWVPWVHKILAWAKKMAWVTWFKILVWVAWVHKVSVDPNFGIGQKNGLFQNKLE